MLASLICELTNICLSQTFFWSNFRIVLNEKDCYRNRNYFFVGWLKTQTSQVREFYNEYNEITPKFKDDFKTLRTVKYGQVNCGAKHEVTCRNPDRLKTNIFSSTPTSCALWPRGPGQALGRHTSPYLLIKRDSFDKNTIMHTFLCFCLL